MSRLPVTLDSATADCVVSHHCMSVYRVYASVALHAASRLPRDAGLPGRAGPAKLRPPNALGDRCPANTRHRRAQPIDASAGWAPTGCRPGPWCIGASQRGVGSVPPPSAVPVWRQECLYEPHKPARTIRLAPPWRQRDGQQPEKSVFHHVRRLLAVFVGALPG